MNAMSEIFTLQCLYREKTKIEFGLKYLVMMELR